MGPTSSDRSGVRALTQGLVINKLYEIFKSAWKVCRPCLRKRAQMLQQNTTLLKSCSWSKKEAFVENHKKRKTERCDEHLRLEAATQVKITTRYLNCTSAS